MANLLNKNEELCEDICELEEQLKTQQAKNKEYAEEIDALRE